MQFVKENCFQLTTYLLKISFFVNYLLMKKFVQYYDRGGKIE